MYAKSINDGLDIPEDKPEKLGSISEVEEKGEPLTTKKELEDYFNSMN